MPTPPSPEDRPDPLDQQPAVRARVPEHVARGEISTGIIVVTGGTEFVLDFVRNLPRPNAVVARVVMPHMVMPQFIEALSTNIELYRQRYGDLPGSPPVTSMAVESHIVHAGSTLPAPQPAPNYPTPSSELGAVGSTPESKPADPASSTGSPAAAGHPPAGDPHPPAASPPPPQPTSATRRHNPQEIYDELKIRDEILSGAYANAVMIGHGPYEFNFDFITNFFPQSAVSARVYMGAGHVWRMLDSLKQSWEQLRPRLGFPPPPPAPPSHGGQGGHGGQGPSGTGGTGGPGGAGRPLW
ncbi:MAG: DUF3467 domain-containing protein [Planctomycetota bacterium]